MENGALSPQKKQSSEQARDNAAYVRRRQHAQEPRPQAGQARAAAAQR